MADNNIQLAINPTSDFGNYYARLNQSLMFKKNYYTKLMGQSASEEFNNRMFNPTTDLDRFGFVKNDMPAKTPFYGRQLMEFLDSMKQMQNKFTNVPLGNDWTIALKNKNLFLTKRF